MQKEYESSQKLFLDIWMDYGNIAEINDKETIIKFLNDLILRSKGSFVLEHYLGFCLYCIQRINQTGNLTQLVWQDFEEYHQKQNAGSLDELEKEIWSTWDYVIDESLFINISKLAFLKVCDHLFILICSNPVRIKDINQRSIYGKGQGKCISKATMPYKKYAFSSGTKEDAKKHIAYISNLPFFSCAIQPKEGFVSSNFASQLMYMATQAEIDRRLSIIEKYLMGIPDGASKELRLQGLSIYKILEGQLLYLYYYKNMKGHLYHGLKHMGLGDLINSLMQSGLYVITNDRLLDMANALLHDPAASFTKEQLQVSLSDVKTTIEQIRRIPPLL